MNTSRIAVVILLIVTCILGYTVAYRQGFVPDGIEVFIFGLILVAGVYAFVRETRKHRDMKQGFPVEDELSENIKYRAGYHTFITSMYVWLALFLFQGWFRDHDTLFGVGVMLPAVIFIGIRAYLSRNLDENAH